MALRSVWVGGVCNFMLVKKQAFQATAFFEKLTVLHMSAYVSLARMYACVLSSQVRQGLIKMQKCAPVSVTSC